MSTNSLETKIQRSGGALRMLRNARATAYPFPIPAEYTNWRDEQESWQRSAVLFDQSAHMSDLTVRGRDALRLLSGLGVNSFRTFGPNKAKQFVACEENGHVIGDAILFGIADDEFSLVGSPTLPDWVAFHAESGDHDVQIVQDQRNLDNDAGRRRYRYQLQGPEALAIVEKAHGGPVDHIRFFNIGAFTIAGRRVRALNHTMTGIPGQEMTGLEMFGPIEDGPAVHEALLSAGAEFGMLEGGAIAYSTTAIESGWLGLILPALYTGESTRDFRQWLPENGYEAGASLGGSFAPESIEDYYVTPWDLGYGRLVRFDHDFLGRSALEDTAHQPHRHKVWLRWHDEDVTHLLAGGLFGGAARTRYLAVPHATYATFQYDAVLGGDELVGFSNKTGYTVNAGAWSSLAAVDEAWARDGAEVAVVWGEPHGDTPRPGMERHVQTTVRATVSTTPLVRGAR